MRDRLAVVAFGGGTGLPVLLRGLRQTSGDFVTAVVTIADDGGSSGRLRQELGIAPPGDVRNCLVALAGRRRLAEVFDYRFEGGVELRDHSVGNIIIAALADMSGGFCEGVEQAGRFLRIKGSVYPAATESLTLVVHHVDGSVTRGESTVREAGRAVRRVAIEPAGAAAPPAVLRAVEQADVVVLSPGSLFTSTIPALLGAGVPDALASFAGPVVYAANIMTQPGETAGFTLSDHLRAITEHVGPVVSDVLMHSEGLPAPLLSRYCAEGAAPVEIDHERIERLGVRVNQAGLLPDAMDAEVRHDPGRFAFAVREIAAAGRLAR
ncbi:MAG: YvcK family protein [Actinomycetota bacterium]|nr:YvcK family protein [Actinomycetota bacterium]